MTKNPLVELAKLGQSPWLDFLDRERIATGRLQRYIEDDGVLGVTSNPTIFEKAIVGRKIYDAPIDELARAGSSAAEIYRAITTHDVQLAADLFRASFDRLDGRDGFVSLEVSPQHAHDTNETIAEARRLFALVGRPNVMIKVPATKEGLAAIEQLVFEGIHVNVTLLFGLDRYEEVAEAYLAGLEARAKKGESLRVASVASFFLSRIDVKTDSRLDELERAGKLNAARAGKLRGEVAIASARVAYQLYKRHFEGKRFRALMMKGARPQRLLWASTGTKNPAYSDVKYVEALIGRGTINTLPLETLDAYRDHGDPALRLEQNLEAARETLTEVRAAGVDLDSITQQLEDDGIKKFIASYEHLLRVIDERRQGALRDSGASAP